jgi:histidinol-phosphate aminotransferase
MSYFRTNIEKMAGYVPGEQPQTGDWVKLNTNENPYLPSPKVREAVAGFAADLLRRYPPPMADAAREAAAKVCGVDVDWVLCGNGSDDLLSILMRCFVGEQDRVAAPWPTYILYETLTRIQGGRFLTVPWGTGWSLPGELAASRASLIFLANPNSPSGTVVPAERIADLAKRFDGMIVVDEAYVDFAAADCLELVRSHENVVVLRTLSKGYSLAGIRFGWAVGQPPIIAGMAKVKDSYNCDAVSIAAAAAALADQPYHKACVQKVQSERGRLTEALGACGCDVTESQANFLWVVPIRTPVSQVYDRLRERRILVRTFPQPDLSTGMRVTVGTPQQNDRLIEAMKEIMA